MTANASRDILPEPPEDLKHLSGQLAAILRERIRERGPLPFSEYMEAALYQPGLGYYSAGLQKFGAGGDFVTAPELGTLFAACLARQIRDIFNALGRRSILEVGAGSGGLAAALLLRLSQDAAGPPLQYRILERSAHLRQVQRETIAAEAPDMLAHVSWLDQPPEQGWAGVMLANEVVDALPVERFAKSGDGLHQLNVIADGDAFDWQPGPPRTALAEAVHDRLGDTFAHLPDGYCSEINLALDAWLSGLTAMLERGCALLIDYGYPRRDYYLPQRRRGTLICHYRHRAIDDPFRWPGLQDITAFVDFTALAEAGLKCGLECSGYTSQAMFLLGSGLDEELASMANLSPDEQLRLGAEARQLAMPSEMGEKFQVMALSRGLDLPLRGFQPLDLRHRL
jgi:SAM-dependent MidA family methyltransferase